MNKILRSNKWAALLPVCLFLFSYTNAQVVRNTKDNTVKSVFFKEGERPVADKVVEVLRKQLELSNEQSLVLKFANELPDGSQIQRYTLYYKNMPVEHSNASLMIRNNEISFINANVFKPSAATIDVPVLSEHEALAYALNKVDAKEYAWENVVKSKLTENNASYQPPVGQLVWVEDFVNEQIDERKLHLAYKFDIYASKPVSRDLIYIDAATGNVLLADPVIKHVNASGASVYSDTVDFVVANTGANVFEMFDSTRKSGTYDVGGGTNLGFATLVNSNTNFFIKNVAVDAHWGATVVYDYWKNEHNRTSYDNAGTEMYSVVNYDVNLNNAYWNGSVMLYGNGTGMFNGGFDPLTTLDICAHEIGHAICQSTSALIYVKESGAMNEGFSDIWGAVIEHYGAPDKDMWSIGEEVGTSPLRSMSNPNIFDLPATYGGNHWVNVIGCTPSGGNDNCGVHTNSSILNYWFYLLTEGGKGTNDNNDVYEVAGIGVQNAARIAYATEQVLSASADYDECRTASINAAETIFGMCSREVEAVTRAWYAVGVGSVFSPCSPQIGFAISDTTVDRKIVGFNCPAKHTISIPLRVTGGAPTGGNAVVTVAATGTAMANVDYVLNSMYTFNAGSAASQNVTLDIIDNGAISGDKTLNLYFAIAQNGSNAITSYTYDTCKIVITGGKPQPDTAGQRVSTVTRLNTITKATTPFYSRNKAARMNFIITAEELIAAGVKPNEPINSLAFNVTQKNSTQNYLNFNLKIGTTTVKDLTGGIPTVTTVYYSGNYTTQLGWNVLPFSTPFVWNGTDNLSIETCFTNISASTENDYVEADVVHKTVSAVAYTNGATNGCSLLFTSGAKFFSVAKPRIRLMQETFDTEVQRNVVSSRQWDINPGQSVLYRNDTSGRLMVNINNAPVPYGCTRVGVTAAGTGMSVIPGVFYQMVQRSVKEFEITPSNNPTTGNTGYEVTLYYDTAELSGVNITNARVVTTNQAVDSMMDGDNTEMVVPVITTKGNRIEFKAVFTGKSSGTQLPKGITGRYFITQDGFNLKPVESVAGLDRNSGNIKVVNNPFSDKIYLQYNLVKNTKAQVVLQDITGKTVWSSECQLSADEHNLELNIAQPLAPGNYILQVKTDTEVMTNKMLKQ